MLNSFLAQALNNLLVGALVVVVTFALLLFTLQRGSVDATLKGIFRAITALLSGPLQYIRNVLTQLAERGRSYKPAPVDDRQLLTKRLLFAGQMTVVLGALLIFAVGVATGWNRMVPSRSNVSAYRDAVARRDSLNRVLPAHRQRLQQLDQTWTRDSARLVQGFADSLQTQAQLSESSRQEIRQGFTGRAAVARRQLLSLIDDLERYPAGTEPTAVRAYERGVRQFNSSARSIPSEVASRLGFAAEDSAQLAEYLGAWRGGRQATLALQAWPPENVRLIAQVEYRSAKDSLDVAEQMNRDLTNALPGLKRATNWEQSEFAKAAGGGLLSAFLYVWAMGVLLELVWLLVDVADNLRRLRAHFDPSGGESPQRRSVGVAAPPEAYRSTRPSQA